MNGYDEVIAAETPNKSIKQALDEKYESGSPNDPVNPSGSFAKDKLTLSTNERLSDS